MNETMERSQIHATFVVERTYPVPAEAVWHALSDSDARDQWFGGGAAFDVAEKSHEFRVGGHGIEEGQWHGGPRSRFRSTYTDIVDLKRIVFTYDMWVDGQHMSTSLATMVLEAAGSQTRLTYTEQAVHFDGLDNPEGREEAAAACSSSSARTSAAAKGTPDDDRDRADVGLRGWLLRRAAAHRPAELDGERRSTEGGAAPQGGTSFTYVTDGIESAVDQARAAANGKNVAVAGGGTLVREVLRLGLLDELELHVVPVILGDGLRLLSPELALATAEGIELTPDRVIATPEVTHVRYKVNGRRPLVLDNRGRDEEPVTV